MYFVEGHAEEVSIQIVGKAMGCDEIGKEIRIIDFAGKDRIQWLTEFLKYICLRLQKPFCKDLVSTEITTLIETLSKTGPLVEINRTPSALQKIRLNVVSTIASGLQPLCFGPQNILLQYHALYAWLS